jgi:hypothetical protein
MARPRKHPDELTSGRWTSCLSRSVRSRRSPATLILGWARSPPSATRGRDHLPDRVLAHHWRQTAVDRLRRRPKSMPTAVERRESNARHRSLSRAFRTRAGASVPSSQAKQDAPRRSSEPPSHRRHNRTRQKRDVTPASPAVSRAAPRPSGSVKWSEQRPLTDFGSGTRY